MYFNKNSFQRRGPEDFKKNRVIRASKRLSSDPPSDARKPLSNEQALGQVPTPPVIANVMAKLLFSKGRPNAPICVLDPCVGDAQLLSAVVNTVTIDTRDRMFGVDIDQKAIRRAKDSLASCCKLDLLNADYLFWDAPVAFDYAILNPPYVRQEWITQKAKYRGHLLRKYNIDIPGTSNLFAYFLVKLINDLKPGGRFVALVYDSMRSTRFGRELSRLIEAQCEDVSYHSVTPQPFENRLIDAVIVAGNVVRKKTSGLTSNPRIASPIYEAPFVRLDSIFSTVRGLRLKQTDVFLTARTDVARLGATPFVKKIQHALPFAIRDTHPEAALLLDRPSPRSRIQKVLTARLQRALEEPNSNRSILAWYRHHPDRWFVHRAPPVAPVLFNYYVRGEPRHLFNPVGPFSDNFYGLTWGFDLSPLAVTAALNSSFMRDGVKCVWRNQGNGLFKVQLYEYRSIPVLDLRLLRVRQASKLDALGRRLIALKTREGHSDLVAQIDEVLGSYFCVKPGDLLVQL